jgi:hypothetical protein
MYYLGLSSGCPICFIVNVNEHSEVNSSPSSYMYLPTPKRFTYVLTKKHLGQQLNHCEPMFDNSSTYYDSNTPYDKSLLLS